MGIAVKVVCFDADQTLIDFRPAMIAALGSTLRQIHALGYGAEVTLQGLIDQRNAAAAALGPRASMEEVRREGFRRVLAPLGAPSEVIQTVTEDYLSERFRLARPYDDVVPTLDKLHDRYTLGLATNGNSYPDRVGIAHYFAFAVYAHDCGFRKPDPQFFATVCEKARCEPHEIVYVGDSPVEDIAGAQAAGMRAIWINRGNTADEPTTAAPDGAIGSLLELQDTLASLM